MDVLVWTWGNYTMVKLGKTLIGVAERDYRDPHDPRLGVLIALLKATTDVPWDSCYWWVPWCMSPTWKLKAGSDFLELLIDYRRVLDYKTGKLIRQDRRDAIGTVRLGLAKSLMHKTLEGKTRVCQLFALE
jgi:hypothetical protein